MPELRTCFEHRYENDSWNKYPISEELIGCKVLRKNVRSKGVPDMYFCLVENYGDYSLAFQTSDLRFGISFYLLDNNHRLFPISGPRLHSLGVSFLVTNYNDLQEALTILRETGRIQRQLKTLRLEKDL